MPSHPKRRGLVVTISPENPLIIGDDSRRNEPHWPIVIVPDRRVRVRTTTDLGRSSDPDWPADAVDPPHRIPIHRWDLYLRKFPDTKLRPAMRQLLLPF